MKETIVLIHGYGFDKRIWSPVELAFNRFNVILLSLPGFGDQVVEEPYSVNALAQRYWLDLEFLKDSRIHLVGHSMGGYVCMEMVAQQPELVASLGLIHSHVFADMPEKKESRTAAIVDIKTSGREALVRKMIPSFLGSAPAEKRIAQKLVDRGMAYDDHAWCFGMEAMRDRIDHSKTLQDLTVPVLMIMGEKDAAVPIEMAYKQAALCESVRLCIYSESRHLAMYDHTAQMIGDLVSFYDDIL